MTKNQKSKTEYLEVEPFRLMHTGNFYGFFINSWKDISPNDVVYFGISTSKFPETNCSISSYIHDERRSIYPIHHVPEHQATAVYTRGYHSRLNLSDRKITDKHTLNELINIFRDKKMPFDYFRDQGLKSKARDIYRVSEIEALVCYSSNDIRLHKEAISKLGIEIPVYQEFENPEFINQFNQNFILIRYNESESEDRRIVIPDSFEGLKNVSKQLQTRMDERIEELKRWYRVVRDAYKVEIRSSIRRNRRLLQKIQEISQGGKILIPEEYQEKAKILFSKFIMENGIPRYQYVLIQ